MVVVMMVFAIAAKGVLVMMVVVCDRVFFIHKFHLTFQVKELGVRAFKPSTQSF